MPCLHSGSEMQNERSVLGILKLQVNWLGLIWQLIMLNKDK